MKKILSVFAAAALLFGFASCSGDLHDVSAVDLSALQLKGSWEKEGVGSIDAVDWYDGRAAMRVGVRWDI